MARLSAREIGRIESTYTSDLGKLTWAWAMKADGRVLYRLSHINGRPERNYWRMLYQLSATERWEVGTDTARATDLLARLARERGHHPCGNGHRR
jgi:hypothetical protein